MQQKQFIILMAALLLIAYGISNKEYLPVLRKATTICLECIGIG